MKTQIADGVFRALIIVALVAISTSPAQGAQAPSDPDPLSLVSVEPPHASWPEASNRLARVGASSARTVDIETGSPLVLAPSVTNGEANTPDLPAPDVTFIAPSDFGQDEGGERQDKVAPIRQVNGGWSAEFLRVVGADDLANLGARVSPVGIAVRLRPVGDSLVERNVPVRFALDYGQARIPESADFVERMGLYRGVDCAFTTDDTIESCDELHPLRGEHDFKGKRLIVDIPAAQLNQWLAGTEMRSDGRMAQKPEDGIIITLSTGVDSPTGDYGAVPVNDVLDYQVGLFAGTAETSYPIPLPPGAAGASPHISLNYDSGSVDGTATSRYAQPSIVGIGWTQKAGAIVRLLKKSPTAGSDNHCWTNAPGGDFVFSLNGVSSRLVRVNAETYALRDDGRWQVKFLTSTLTTHPDAEKRFWLVTSPDGTQYRFGG